MTDPKDMTTFQKFVDGLRIIERYFDKITNPGEIEPVEGIITICGVGPLEVSDEDRTRLEALGWYAWSYDAKMWKFAP